jgi:copper chaperone CopZ
VQVVLRAPKIHCGGCVAAVTDALRSLPGVTRAEADAVSKEVRVEYDPARVNEADIRAAMASAGFPAG